MTASLPRRCHQAQSRRFCPPNLFRRRRACRLRPIASDSGGLRGAGVPGHDDKLFLRAGLSVWRGATSPHGGLKDRRSDVSPCIAAPPENETCRGANNMMEILNSASVEIASAMIFAWFLMVACLGGDPELASQRVTAPRK